MPLGQWYPIISNHLEFLHELQKNKPNCFLDILTWIFRNISNVTCNRGLLPLSRTPMSHPKLPPAQTAHRGHDHLHPLGSSSQSVTVFLDSWPPLTVHFQSHGALCQTQVLTHRLPMACLALLPWPSYWSPHASQTF